MARPFKQGVDYYPEFCNEFEKNEYYLDVAEEFGPLGESVLKRISNWVYAEGYYLETDINTLAKRLRMSIRSKWVNNVAKIIDIINYAADIGFIDKNLMLQGVITSTDFQKNYCFLVERRKNIDISKYWLIEEKPFSNTANNSVNDSNNSINVCNNSINDNNNTQIKLNQIKSKQTDKINKYDKELFMEEFNFLTRIIIEKKLVAIDDVDVFEYDAFLEKKIKQGISKKDLLRICNYVVKHMLTKNNIDNKIGYFIKSFECGTKAINRPDFDFKSWTADLAKKLTIK